MKYIKAVILLILVASLVFGCKKSDEDIIKVDKELIGESEHWKVSYKAKGYINFYKDNGTLMVKSDGSYKIALEYKGTQEELDTIRMTKVEYPMGSSMHNSSDSPDSFIFNYTGSISTTTVQKISQGEKLEITVKWDGINGSTETIYVE